LRNREALGPAQLDNLSWTQHLNRIDDQLLVHADLRPIRRWQDQNCEALPVEGLLMAQILVSGHQDLEVDFRRCEQRAIGKFRPTIS
jgi:hypothetical protein